MKVLPVFFTFTFMLGLLSRPLPVRGNTQRGQSVVSAELSKKEKEKIRRLISEQLDGVVTSFFEDGTDHMLSTKKQTINYPKNIQEAIERAKTGDIASMVFVIFNDMRKGLDAFDLGDLEKAKKLIGDAMEWDISMLIRMKQDLACCDRPHGGFGATIGLVSFVMGQLLCSLQVLCYDDLQENDYQKKLDNHLIKAINWVRDLTEKNILENPTAFDFECKGEKPNYLPQEKWKQLRLNVLDELGKEVS